MTGRRLTRCTSGTMDLWGVTVRASITTADVTAVVCKTAARHLKTRQRENTI